MPRRLHRVEFSWFETKTYPIATHLDARSTWNLSRRTKATRPRAEHHSKFKSRDRRWLLGSIGWGEPKAKRKHCTRTPFVRFFFRCRLFGSLLFREGKVTCVPVVLETERCSVTQTRTHSKRSRVSPWHHTGRRHCVSCSDSCSRMTTVMWACVCVWAIGSSQQRVWWKFSISKWRPTFFRNLCVWVFRAMGIRFTVTLAAKFGSLALLIARLKSFISTEIDSLFPTRKKPRRKLLVPIDCRKVKFMLWDWPPLRLIGSGESWYCSVPLWNYWFR